MLSLSKHHCKPFRLLKYTATTPKTKTNSISRSQLPFYYKTSTLPLSSSCYHTKTPKSFSFTQVAHNSTMAAPQIPEKQWAQVLHEEGGSESSPPLSSPQPPHATTKKTTNQKLTAPPRHQIRTNPRPKTRPRRSPRKRQILRRLPHRPARPARRLAARA